MGYGNARGKGKGKGVNKANCKFCFNEFEKKYKSLYCSGLCKSNMKFYLYLNSYKIKYETVLCETCGKEIIRKNKKIGFCSKRCKQIKRKENPSKSTLRDIYTRCIECGDIISLYGHLNRSVCDSLKCKMKWKRRSGFKYKKYLHEYKKNNKSFICHYCKQLLPVKHKHIKKQITIDHIKPMSHTGEDDKDNWVFACMECNSSKGTMNYNDHINKLNNKEGQMRLAI